MILKTLSNASCCQSDLTGNKVLTTALRLMIKENSIHCKHAISFSVFFHDPVAVLLCHCIRAVRVKRCRLLLRYFLYLSVQFRSRCLIDPASLLQSTHSDSFQYSQYTGCIDVCRELRHIKAYLHMRLRCQIIDFIRFHLADQFYQADRISQIAEFQMKMRSSLQMRDAFSIIYGRTTDHAVDFISFLQ